MAERLAEYLKADRAWKRPQRIAHARFQMGQTQDANEKAFWANVLVANQWRPYRHGK